MHRFFKVSISNTKFVLWIFARVYYPWVIASCLCHLDPSFSQSAVNSHKFIYKAFLLASSTRNKYFLGILAWCFYLALTLLLFVVVLFLCVGNWYLKNRTHFSGANLDGKKSSWISIGSEKIGKLSGPKVSFGSITSWTHRACEKPCRYLRVKLKTSWNCHSLMTAIVVNVA